MGSRVVIVSWLILAACGRLGFDEHVTSSTVDANGDGGSVVSDGPSNQIDGPPADAFLCAYMTCPLGRVTCCETSGAPMCIDTADACMSNRRFECEQPTNTGCSGGEVCCLTLGSLGTECINPLIEPCFG